MKRTYSVYGSTQSLSAKRRRLGPAGYFKKSRDNRGAWRRGSFAGRSTIPRGIAGPFPMQRIAKLRYCMTTSLDATSATRVLQQFRANSLYDPDFTGGGHQPYGYDTLESIYNHYEVLSSCITVTGVPSSINSANAYMTLGVLISDDSTVTSSVDTIREQSNGKFVLLGGGGTPATIVQKYNRDVMFPRSSDYSTGALVSTNPTDEAYFTVYAAPIAGVEPGAVYIQVTLDFVARFWELKDLLQST